MRATTMSHDFSENVWQQAKRGSFDALTNALKSKNAELTVDFVYGPMQEAFLHLAAAKGNAELCQLLIGADCNLNVVNRQGVTALYIACAANAPDVVEAFMKSGANPNTIVPTGACVPAHRRGVLRVFCLCRPACTTFVRENVAG